LICVCVVCVVCVVFVESVVCVFLYLLLMGMGMIRIMSMKAMTCMNVPCVLSEACSRDSNLCWLEVTYTHATC